MGASPVIITPDAPQQSTSRVTIMPDPAPRTWEDSVSDFGKALWNQVNPISGIKGAAQMAAHPIDALKNDANARQQVYSQAESAFKKGNYPEGAAHLLYAALPFIGPQLNGAASDLLQGKTAQGLGSSVGMGLALAGPGAIKDASIAMPGIAEGMASKMYQSALKPSRTMGAARIANAVGTGLEQGIPVSPAGVEKIGGLMDDLNSQIKAQMAGSSKTINKFAVTSRLGNLADKFANQVNPETDLNSISESGNEFLRNQPAEIPAEAAQSIKQGTYQQIKKSYGQLSNATLESQKSLARGIKEELATQFPELSDLNAQDSKLINLDGALQSAVQRISNHQLFGIGTPLAAAGAKAVTGSSPAALAAATVKGILDNPEIKSKLAIAINRASKTGITLDAAKAKVAAYSSALGNFAQQPIPGATAIAGQPASQ